MTYVLLVFAYQQDYDHFKSRVCCAKSKAERDARELFERLNDTLVAS